MKIILKFSELFSSIVLVSVLFMITNLITVFNFIGLLYANKNIEIFLSSLLLILSFIFIVFPSLIGMVEMSREWVINKTFKVNPLLYFKKFSKNYRNSIPSGVVLATMFLILTFYFIYYSSISLIFSYMLKLIIVLTIYLTLTSALALAHYEIKGFKAVIKAIQLLLYPRLLMMLIILSCIFMFIFYFIGLFYASVIISLYFYLLFSTFYKLYSYERNIVTKRKV